MYKKNYIVLTGIFALGLLSFNATAALPNAGSVIGNQAIVTYNDGGGNPQTVTSNVVQITVSQVAGYSISAPNTDNAGAGEEGLVALTITNTGNGNDFFSLVPSDGNTGNLDFSTIVIYPDANGDGIPDGPAITQTPVLAPGETFTFLIGATAENGAFNGETDTLVLDITSDFDPVGVNDSLPNSGTITVSGAPNIVVTKSLSSISGQSPSAAPITPITVTLEYTNTGTVADALDIQNIVPVGFTYVPNSGNWSEQASVLTDASDSDVYSVLGNQIDILLGNVPVGVTASFTFDLNVDADLPTGDITSFATYDLGGIATPTNTVTYTVVQEGGVTLANGSTSNALQGESLIYTLTVTNDGNGDDVFNISELSSTFPAGTTFGLFSDSSATVALTDTNSDTIPDTGTLAKDATFTYYVRVNLPPSASGVASYGATLLVASTFNPAVTGNPSISLNEIIASVVDVSLNGTAVANGDGANAPFTTVSNITEGTPVNLTLFIRNVTGLDDSYNVSVSARSDTSYAVTLPASVSVVQGATNSTGTVNVSIPANMVAEQNTIEITVTSPTTGATDTIVATFEVLPNATAALVNLTPSVASGNEFPNGQIFYTFVLNNNSNVALNTGTITLSDNIAQWVSRVYNDLNGNGVVDVGDIEISALSTVTSVNPFDTMNLLVEINTSDISDGTLGLTTLNLSSLNNSDNPFTDFGALSAITRTTVVAGNIDLVTEQAPDVACDGTPDSAFSVAQISEALPGSCVVYRVTSSNLGTAIVDTLELTSSIPSFTTYFTCGGSCPASGAYLGGSAPAGIIINALAEGATGDIVAQVPTVDQTESYQLTYVVKIDE